jgi:DNA-binding CsgD family transcriptional regulator
LKDCCEDVNIRCLGLEEFLKVGDTSKKNTLRLVDDFIAQTKIDIQEKNLSGGWLEGELLEILEKYRQYLLEEKNVKKKITDEIIITTNADIEKLAERQRIAQMSKCEKIVLWIGDGIKQTDIARMLKVSQPYISKIKKRAEFKGLL